MAAALLQETAPVPRFLLSQALLPASAGPGRDFSQRSLFLSKTIRGNKQTHFKWLQKSRFISTKKQNRGYRRERSAALDITWPEFLEGLRDASQCSLGQSVPP